MLSRYAIDNRINGGEQLSTANSIRILRKAISGGNIPIIRNLKTTGFDRLDNLAGAIYGDAKYWWILAAASNIGWGLQVPPGTLINVVPLEMVQRLIGV